MLARYQCYRSVIFISNNKWRHVPEGCCASRTLQTAFEKGVIDRQKIMEGLLNRTLEHWNHKISDTCNQMKGGFWDMVVRDS